MNTKIDLNNLENENIVNIADRLGVLSEDSGDVFTWASDSIPSTKPHTFSSEENAKEYGILRNEFYMRRGMIERDKPKNYIIGTENSVFYPKIARNRLHN